MVLDSGTLLMSAPKGAKKRAVLAGPVVVTGTDFQMSNVGGQAKVIGLNGKTLVTTAVGRVGLRPGEMVVVDAGATSAPKPTAIDLSKMVGSSELMKMGPLPNQGAIEKSAAKQKPAHTFKVGALSPEGIDPVVGVTAQMAQTEAITVRAEAITVREAAVAQQIAMQQAAELAAQQQLENARQQRAAQLRATQVLEQQIAREQQARVAAEQQRAALVARETAAKQQNQGNAFGPGGNQGQGNQGQGPGEGQGNKPPSPPGQDRPRPGPRPGPRPPIAVP